MNNTPQSAWLDIVNRLLAALLALGALAATCQGQTFTTIKSFGVLSNISGMNPYSRLVQAPDGTLYGTTPYAEGSVRGVVFKIQPDGSGFTVLKPFTNWAEGAAPEALVLSNNVLFGTTESGGASGIGTVFKINTDGSGYTVLKHFGAEVFAADGANPAFGFALDNGVLYGATLQGGNGSWGTLFRINTDGTGFTNLLHFSYSSPRGIADIVVSNSIIYATAAYGGAAESGAVIRLGTDGSQYSVLKEFNGSDGRYPIGVVLSGSTLYGTAYTGGASDNGVLFSISTNGTGFSVLRHFDATNAAKPRELILSSSVLYGVTSYGGSNDNGTIYRVNTNGTGFTVLKSFSGPDGSDPEGQLVVNGSVFYGVTYRGGDADAGTIFKINTDGSAHTVLKHFGPSDARTPYAGLALSGGTLYGTTRDGGSSGRGTVFRVSTNGSDYAVLKSFTGTDGNVPEASVIESGGVLYGTTRSGGSLYFGAVFKLNTNGSAFTVLRNFGDDTNGTFPSAEVVVVGNVLFGTTEAGGDFNEGTVFRINTDGTGFAVIKHFTGTDGSTPLGKLIESGGVLYGTTSGGVNYPGTVFKIKPDGSEFAVLQQLQDNPNAGLTLSDGVLYGTGSGQGGFGGDGSVFRLNLDGSGFTVLKNLTYEGGAYPNGEVAVLGGKIFGTTTSGGISNNGTLFRMNTDGTGYRVLHHFTESASIGALVLSNQVLYGTASGGGSLGDGSIFALDLSTITTPVVRYVNVDSANPTPPYTNWATAAVAIQDALNISLADDQVIVTNGTYSLGAKEVSGVTNRVVITNYLSVQSVNGPRFTAIDGGGLVRCAYVGADCRLTGFTLTNGTAAQGGGFMGESIDALVINCVLAGNSATVGGGAYGGTLMDCTLKQNAAAAWGGGADSTTLKRCTVSGNSAIQGGGGASDSTLYNCVVANNIGGGVNFCAVLHGTISGNIGGGAQSSSLFNSISYFNTPEDFDLASDLHSVCASPDPGGGENIITNAPLFVNAESGNFRLQTNSACINSGDPNLDSAYGGSELGTGDLDGRPRFVGNPDLGAFESQPGVSGEFIGWLSGCGLPTDGSADYTDFDSDLLNNWQEWIAGTDPTNSMSALRLLSPTNDLSGLVVRWQSVSNRTYFLERSTNLATGTFSSVASNIVGQVGTAIFTDTNAVNSGPFFYRVGVQP